ncbi:hypothetical protein HJC23_003072 [Cyclotella cryptica]|uniref:Methyltransferase domain-containing protein n=1 Tax=Cyclotella cryptica TaxID=29204 RepID=A0ABD3PZN2_9STRA|eukprot:CCRYP_010240-RA/>CCRYP_010240-RA protein AED:0.01 eAED:0.01 QI:217/1/1/1/1/1/2/2138/230
MLAPRKTLWSTPQSAIDTAIAFADLHANDVVYDVGCGDGRVLIQMASKSIPVGSSSDSAVSPCDLPRNSQHHHCHRFVGIEISPERAEEARANVQRAKHDNRIGQHVSIEIKCANALEVDYNDATVIFLYLVPRGLRLIRPILWSQATNQDTVLNRTTDSRDHPAACEKSQLNKRCSNTRQVQQNNNNQRPRRVITYMNPIENKVVLKKELCKVGNVEGAAFPIYLYHLG